MQSFLLPAKIKMYKPTFPYKDNQIILSSNRITIHSKTDAIFLFGKQTVSLSSPNTINLDATEGIKLYSPFIELGHNAKKEGEPVVLGTTTVKLLTKLFTTLEKVSESLSRVSEGKPGASMQHIKTAGELLSDTSKDLRNAMEQNAILSTNTYTR